jgi:hypothetical protein
MRIRVGIVCLGVGLAPLRLAGAGEPEQADSILRAIASKDCTCEMSAFGEPEPPLKARKGQAVGTECTVEGDRVECGAGFATRVTCPKACLQVYTQGRLTREELKKEVTSFVTRSAGPAYAKRVPRPILESLGKKYPGWLPALFNPSGPFIANFKLLPGFHFEIPIRVDGKVQAVTVVYFFQGLDHLLASDMNWSFWVTSTGQLLHDSVAPYKAFADGYYNVPCPAPAGPKLDEIVLSGIAAGEGDAGGCCGPYSLTDLKEKGPLKIGDSRPELYDPDVVYSLCGRSTDSATGKWAPQSLYEIDGPANVRRRDELPHMPVPHGKAEIIGSCADHARVADLGSNGHWHHVYCEGKSGWMHRTNIRWPKK